MNKKLIGAFLALAVLLGGVRIANAQGFIPDGFWKRVGGALLPIRATDSIGSSAQRIPTVYATNLDGVNLVINGSAPGGITLPWVDATSTSRASNIQRLIVGNSTTTNATTTNQFVSSLFATSGNIPLLTSAGINFTNATGTNATTTNMFSTNGNITNLLSSNSLLTGGLIDGVPIGSISSSTAQFNNATTSRLGVKDIWLMPGYGINTVDNTFVVAASGQITINYGGTALNAVGSVRTSATYTVGGPLPFNLGGKPTAGTGWEAAADKMSLANGLQRITVSSGSAATSTRNVQYLMEGLRNTSTIVYIGTGDGCGRLTFATSNTFPALTPTAVANCNP